MTPDEMKEKIAQLEKENAKLQSFLDNGKGDKITRGNCRVRIRTNNKEIMNLKCALICIKRDDLF